VLLIALIVLLVVSPAFAAVPAPERPLTDPKTLGSASEPMAHPVPIGDLFFSRGLGGAAWSPDGKEVVLTTNLTGRYNLWKVSSDGGWPVQLTQSDDRHSGASWSPDGKTIVFESDRAGGEIFDLYAVPAGGGAIENLTHSDDVSETDALFSPDGKLLAFDRKPENSSATDVAVLDTATRAVRQLTHEATKDHAWQVMSWAPDGSALYATRYNAGFTDASAWRIELADGKSAELTPHKGDVLIAVSAVSSDGNTLALSSDAKDGKRKVGLFYTSGKSYRWITQGPWEARSGEFSPDGMWLVYALNEDGRTTLFRYRIDSGKSERLPLPDGVNSFAGNPNSFSGDGTRLLVSHESSTTVNDYWVLDLARNDRHRLTRSALAGLDAARLPAAELVHYRSFDGTVISAFMWLPFNLERDGTAPAVVLPHGGPTGQTRDVFNRAAVALTSRGYVCIAPNVRGSTGYGNAFQKANIKDLGGGDLKDEVYAAKFLVTSGYVDAKKVGIYGASYGGYMALIALGRTPEVWAAGVDWYGITNWLTEQEHEEPAIRQYDQTLLGDPVKDRAIYERASATTYFSAIKAPLLVLQGANDIRDPKEEAESAFATLKAQGKVVEAHYYEDEGHGFAKRENQIDALERTVAFFDKYLKPARAKP
jgi:dipeptidyl aminopeptidase/acylaminoacyl peptidase